MKKYKIEITKSKIITVIIVVIFIGFLIYHNEYAIKYPEYKIKIDYAPKDIWSLFKDNNKKNLIANETQGINTPNPISAFSYLDRRYNVTVFKLTVPKDTTLKDLISRSNNDHLDINNIPWSTFSGIFNMYLKPGDHHPSHMRVTLIGDKTDTVANNKNVLGLYSEFKTFFIKYDKSDTAAIWAKTNDTDEGDPVTEIPMEIAFVKHSNALYLIIMARRNNGHDLPKNQLVDMLADK
ncbi:MAG: hypothetical protein ACTHJ8_08355 [Mucilaginibacter sp.]|jgi:hypothetical protein